MKTMHVLLVVLMAGAILCGCGGEGAGQRGDSPAATDSTAVSQLEASATSRPAPSTPSSPTAMPSTAAPAPSPAAAPPTSAPATAPVASEPAPGRPAYEDMRGVRGEEEIAALAALGVFDGIGGKFEPGRTVTRAEFVRWFMRANQAIWFDNQGRLIASAKNATATFDDVPSGHPDFVYIQGMVNAGYLTYFGKNRFRPGDLLTREEMIDIKVMVDQLGRVASGVVAGQVERDWGFTDAGAISTKYLPAILDDRDPYLTAGNIERVFGAVKVFEPKKAATRAEVALCIAVQGARGSTLRSASEALRMQKR